MQKLKGRRTRVSTLAFAPEHPYLAACDAHGETHIWDTSSGTLLAFFDLPRRYFTVGRLYFLPDGRCLVPHDDGWSIIDATTKKKTTHKQRLSGYTTVSTDGRYVVSCGSEQEFRVYDLTKDKLVWDVVPSKRRFLASMPNVAHDNQTLLTLEFSHEIGAHEGKALVTRQLLTGEIQHKWPCPDVNLMGLELSADGQTAAGFTSRSVLLWNLKVPESKPQKFVNPSKQHLVGIALYPGGDKLATIANDRYVRVLDTTNGVLQTTLEWDIGKLHAIRFSPDGLRAAVGSGRGTVLVWDVE